MNIDELKQKPVAMMTGEELSFLIDSRMATWATEIASLSQRRIYYGIEGIARDIRLQCSNSQPYQEEWCDR